MLSPVRLLLLLLSACPTASFRAVATRRTAVFGGAAAAFSTMCGDAAFAEDAKEIRDRARQGKLTVDRAIQRARDDALIEDVSEFDCVELQKLVEVDRKAAKKQQAKVAKMEASVGTLVSEAAEENLKKMIAKEKKVEQTIEMRLSEQVRRLETAAADQICPSA